MADAFDQRFPNIADWVLDGWIEIGRDEHSRSFIRVFDIGGVVFEGQDRYESVEAALQDAETAIAAWYEKNG